MKITVSGMGYVGLVTGVALSHIGHKVTCVDVNQEKINLLKNGICPIYEPGLEVLIKKNKKRLSYTSQYKQAYAESDLIIICVGTPEKQDGSVNLDYVYLVCEQIAESLKNDCVVVLKSTVPIGINDKIEEKLNDEVKKGIKVHVVSNPEFLSQGTAVHDTLYASRIVVGTDNNYVADIMYKLYKPLTKEPYKVPYLLVSRKSAEMIKYASNTFLALKLSYINEIANLCKQVGADIEDVSKGMGLDDRIGKEFLKAGIGYGGSCFPKDTKALHWLSIIKGIELKTVKACIEVNDAQTLILFNQLKQDLGNLNDRTVAILGLAFKPNTDDLRNAPAIINIKKLLSSGAKVKVYDPVAIDNFKRNLGKYEIENLCNLKFCESIDEAIINADALMIMTEWPDIVNYDISKYQELMKTPRVYDGRNCYRLEDIQDVLYFSIGR